MKTSQIKANIWRDLYSAIWQYYFAKCTVFVPSYALLIGSWDETYYQEDVQHLTIERSCVIRSNIDLQNVIVNHHYGFCGFTWNDLYVAEIERCFNRLLAHTYFRRPKLPQTKWNKRKKYHFLAHFLWSFSWWCSFCWHLGSK